MGSSNKPQDRALNVAGHYVVLKGTMNALFLKDLADKTRRSLRGRIEQGKSGGGDSHGYTVVKQFDGDGEAVRGDRRIDPDQARVVRRISRTMPPANPPSGSSPN